MKRYYFIAIAATIFAACADTDSFKEVTTQETPIGFSSEYASKTTKAEINSNWLTADGSNFGVYGYKTERNSSVSFLYDNVEVTYGLGDWTYGNEYVRYWDKLATNAYDFYAYAPYKASTTFTRTAENNGPTGFTYQLDNQIFADATVSSTIDLCVADVEGTDYAHCYSPGTTTASDGHVSFTFDHVLSKLTFQVVRGTNVSAAHGLTLTGLKVGFPTYTATDDPDNNDNIVWTQTAKNAYNGTVSYANGVVTQPTSAGTTLFDNANQNVTTTKAVVADANSFIVTPNAETEKHTIKLEVAYTLNYTHSDPAQFADTDVTDQQIARGTIEQAFAENTHYTITIVINPEKIDFDVDAINGFSSPATDVEKIVPEAD